MVSKGASPAEQPAYHHGNLRAALIEKAADQLGTQQLREISLRELAAALGVSTAAPYSHFKNKEDLWGAIAEEGFRVLAGQFATVVARTSPGREQLIALVRSFLAFSRDKPGFYKVMFQSSASREHQRPSRDNYADEVLRLTSEVLEATCSPCAPAEVRKRAILLCATLHGLIVLEEAGPFDRLGSFAELESLAIDAALQVVKSQSASPHRRRNVARE